MKKNYKKTFIGSIAAFFLGTSCCWISSLAIWLGGATVLTTIANYLGKVQYFIIVLGVLLAIWSLVLFF